MGAGYLLPEPLGDQAFSSRPRRVFWPIPTAMTVSMHPAWLRSSATEADHRADATKSFESAGCLRARFGRNKQGHPVVRWQVNGEAVQIIDDGKVIAAEHI